MTADELKPKDHAEAIALFRAQLIGPLLCRDVMSHGERSELLRELSALPVKPPGSPVSRMYAPTTLERWLYAYRKEGLNGLKPKRRCDSGHGQALCEQQRELLLAIRRERPAVSATLILRTLEADGRLPKKLITACTLRRLYKQEGLDRVSLSQRAEQPRRRWQAARPNALWHADVCHGPAMRIDGRSVPLRIHAILDDYSRYIVAIQACTTERESEMLALMVKAVRLNCLPDVLYLDNGPTYCGDALRTACGRLGVTLLHAKPYDAQARGKMERFWRTLREQCLSHLGAMTSLHDVQVRLLAWLDRHYLATPHASLMGRTPLESYETMLEQRDLVSEQALRQALTVRGRRRIRRDGTLMVAGTLLELEQGFLSGKLVTIARSLIDPTELPWVEHEDERLALHRVDPIANGQRPRYRRNRRGIDAVPFDPPGALLAELTKRGQA